MPGQRQLDKDAVDIRVIVQLVDQVEEFVLANGGVEAQEGGLVADLRAGFDFGGDVGLAGAVVADQYGGEVRYLFSFCL